MSSLPHCDPTQFRKQQHSHVTCYLHIRGRLRLKCDGTRTETRFRLSAKRTSPFKSVGASVQSTTGRRGVRISGSNAGYTTLRSSVKDGYPIHSTVSPSLPLQCLTVCHRISTGLYSLQSQQASHPCGRYGVCRVHLQQNAVSKRGQSILLYNT